MFAAYGLIDLTLHVVIQQGRECALLWDVGFGSSLNSKECFLVEVLKRQPGIVCNGLVFAVPLPEQMVQKALVYLPQLAQCKAIPGGGQSGKGRVGVLLISGLVWLLVHYPHPVFYITLSRWALRQAAFVLLSM